MRFVAAIFMLMLVVVGAVLVLKQARPDLYYGMVSDDGKSGAAEENRLARIAILPIGDSKRAILIRHTIFLGATKEMVELSLGLPKQRIDPAVPSPVPSEIWTYQFEGDTKTTFLTFRDQTLVDACRGAMPCNSHETAIGAPPAAGGPAAAPPGAAAPAEDGTQASSPPGIAVTSGR